MDNIIVVSMPHKSQTLYTQLYKYWIIIRHTEGCPATLYIYVN